MKKPFSCLIFLLALLPALAACGKYDYSVHLSEVRSDLFVCEDDEFTVTLSCVTREYPYLSDGATGALTNIVEIVLESSELVERDYCVYVLGEREWGGDMSFRNVRGDWFYSQSVSAFPEGSVSLRVSWGDETREVVATSVKNEATITPEAALEFAVAAETDYIKNLTQDGVFRGEFYVRLLRRDKNYYYVGIVDTNGRALSLLLDSETGEVLARREPN